MSGMLADSLCNPIPSPEGEGGDKWCVHVVVSFKQSLVPLLASL